MKICLHPVVATIFATLVLYGLVIGLGLIELLARLIGVQGFLNGALGAGGFVVFVLFVVPFIWGVSRSRSHRRPVLVASATLFVISACLILRSPGFGNWMVDNVSPTYHYAWWTPLALIVSVGGLSLLAWYLVDVFDEETQSSSQTSMEDVGELADEGVETALSGIEGQWYEQR